MTQKHRPTDPSTTSKIIEVVYQVAMTIYNLIAGIRRDKRKK